MRLGPLHVPLVEALLVAIACVVPAGWIARLPLDGHVRALVGFALLVLPAWILHTRRRRHRSREEDVLTRSSRVALSTFGGLVVLLAILGLTPLGLRAGLWIIALSTALVPALGALPSVAERPSRFSTSMAGSTFVRPLLIILAVGLGLWMAVTPGDARLFSDGPAHLGGIHDAVSSDRFWPHDASFPGAAGRPDPRFGVLHGFFAAVAGATGSHPDDVLAAAPVILTPLWLLAHAAWFAAWGSGPLVAILLSLLFTIAGAGGRGFALWSVGYPGNAAMVVAALGAAEFWRSLREARSSPLPGPREGLAVVALAASVTIHPFAWWITSSVLLLGAILGLMIPTQRARALALLSRGFLVTAGGALLLIPRLLERSASADGLHQIPTDALFVSHNLFVMDPLVLARWGGLTALAAGPLLLLRGRKWWDRPWAPVAAAAALLTWIVALVPWIATWAWSLVSYLLVRTLRLVHTPWWWWTAFEEGLGRARRERRWTSRGVGLVLALTGAILLAGEVRNVAQVLREGTPHYLPKVETRLQQMADATDALDTAAIITDPRTSYGLRSLRGGTWVTYPVAHASPNDLGIAGRLTAYRELFDSLADSTVWTERWKELGGSHLLLHLEPTRFALGREFGWIPDPVATRSLAERLSSSPSELVGSGDAWQLWRIEGWPRAAASSPMTVGFTAEAPALARGSHFDVLAVDVAESVAAPGDTLSLRIVLRAADNGRVTDQPDWEQVFVRLEGPMPTTPAWTRGFGKLYRKFFIEKKGRSASRFGGGWIPANGHTPPTRWPESGWEETRRLVIPAHVPSGEYTVQVTVQESAWRARRQLGDYLHDTDRYSAPPTDALRIER